MNTPDEPILLSPPHMGEEERAMVTEAFDTNWIAPVGPHIDAFEKELAEKVGTRGAVALSSGTAALHLALRLLDIGEDDTVFCSTLTFIASVNPVLYQGAGPVFIDSEPVSWNMSPAALERALADADRNGKLPAAIMIVHIYGQSADMPALQQLAERYGVPIVEDAAESLGAFCGGAASGTLGRFGIYSFNGNKIITTSGGGALVSDDLEALALARKLATQGRDPAEHYQHSTMAYNYRLSNVLAGIGRAQLVKLEDRVSRRRTIFDRYRDSLADIDAIAWMPEPNWSRGNRWLSVCTFDPGKTAVTPERMMLALRAEKIEARPVWKPMHLQPLFEGVPYYPHEDGYSVSDRLFETGLCLPSGSALTEAQQDRVIDIMRRTMAG
ncbi:DegT/DnrJ/EryC1/StrS family aminotransferase [Minwuia sp.]|uniref:DegT/DnrJ/EryC1/StrS family aminotransferase n=1 Tax=Minwuia sp. TaxID=2493630 RepID=UPI003A8DF487